MPPFLMRFCMLILFTKFIKLLINSRSHILEINRLQDFLIVLIKSR